MTFLRHLVGNGQFLATFGSSARQYLSSVFRSHTLHKAVFVLSFTIRGLKRSFHDTNLSRQKGSANVCFFLSCSSLIEK